MVDKTAITLPVKPHEKNYWQVQGFSYSYDNKYFNRQFNVIFSTTTLDITVPQILFNLVKRILNPQESPNGYVFDCKNRSNAKDISLKLFDQNVVIKSSVYTDEIDKKCYLRLKPVQGNDWVLGLQFYYGYSACFQGMGKKIVLNKNSNTEFVN